MAYAASSLTQNCCETSLRLCLNDGGVDAEAGVIAFPGWPYFAALAVIHGLCGVIGQVLHKCIEIWQRFLLGSLSNGLSILFMARAIDRPT